MEIGPFISNLLFENEKIVLPNFGEFSTKYIPARFIPEEKKIESPKKQIEFSSEIKQGEPLLANYIAEITKTDPAEIEKKLESFVAAVYSSLDEGHKVKIEQVGVFLKGDDGQVAFEPDTSINYLTDTIGLGPVSSPPKRVKPSAPEKTSEAVAPETNVEPIESSIKSQPTVKMEKPEPVQPKLVAEEPTKIETPFKKERKRRKLGWMWFLLVLLIMAIAIYFLLPTISKLFEKQEPTVVEIVDPEPQPEPEPEPDPFEVKPFLPESGVATYFIVVGAFPSLELAEEKSKELREAGGIYARPFMLTQTGYHRVSYGYYSDIEEAEADLVKVKEMGYPDAYIFRHRPR
jgi:nucleoid DNA-binding protein